MNHNGFRLVSTNRCFLKLAVLSPVVWIITVASPLIAESDGEKGSQTKLPSPALIPQTQPSESSDPITAALLPIQGVITDTMADGLERRIEEARNQGAKLIVFDLDTPGGLVTSSIRIADLIKEIQGIKTVAWVNPNAHSGGSMVAVAAEEIVMSRSSRIGDSQVIMSGPGGAGAVPEELQPKAYTPVLTEFRASARLRGYSQVLCEAFVLPEKEVWWLEHIETGEREFVFDDEKLRRLGEVESSIFKEQTSAAEPSEPKWKLVETYHDVLLDKEVEAIQPVVRNDQLLEMSASEAYAYGFNKGVVTDMDELKARYNIGELLVIEPNWSEDLAYWLTSMYVRGFLLIIIFLGAYVEFHTPGVGVPGLVALIALAIFVGAPYLTGLANAWEIAAIALGALLLMLELFVIPGFGVAGISGLIMIFAGLLFSFVPDEPGRSFPFYIPSLESTTQYLFNGLKIMVSSMVLSILGMIMIRPFLPRLPYFNKLIPANPTPSEIQVDDAYFGAARVGDRGEAIGPLRPAGKARFGSILVDVVTQGDFLETGATVEVIERRGNKVVVRTTRSRQT